MTEDEGPICGVSGVVVFHIGEEMRSGDMVENLLERL